MFRVLIEANGHTAYQRDVSTEAYAMFEAQELASADGDGVKVASESDLVRYQTTN